MSSSGQPKERVGEILSHERCGQNALQGEVLRRAMPAQLEAARPPPGWLEGPPGMESVGL